MKRGILCLLALLLIALPLLGLAEGAEVIGRTEDGEGSIVRYTLPDGQQIIYSSWSDDQYVEQVDVNFDGKPDLAAMTVQGASNLAYTFFVATDNGYLPLDLADPLYNYELLPEKGMILTQINEGWAGSLCTMQLYRWEGSELRLIRVAFSQVAAEHNDSLEMAVMDLSGDMPAVLWSTTVPALAEDAITYALQTMRDTLLSVQ